MKVPTPQKLPSGNWHVKLRIGGEYISITRPTKKACEDEARLIKAEYLAGKRIADESSPAETPTPTLSASIDAYIENRKNVLSPSTVRGYKAIKSSRFLSHMEEPIDAIDWQAAINEEAAKNCSPKTIKNAWGLVKPVLTANGITAAVRLPAPKPHEAKWLTPEEIPLFLDAIRDTPGEIGALLALSSLRRSEIYGLDWNDIDLKKQVIHVRQSLVLGDKAAPVLRDKNKNYTSTRDIPIFLPRLAEVLEAVEEKKGPVVTGNIGTLRKRITRACDKAGVLDVGVHGLRHSFCSLCYKQGVSELACMKLGGWSDYQTMRKIYTHLSESDRMKDADKLKSFFKTSTKTSTDQKDA